jgi:hypothetical protein
MKIHEWETIDEALYLEAGEKEIVQVSKDNDYSNKMLAQAERVLNYLKEKYPDRIFRRKWYDHDFGSYIEVEEYMTYDDGEDEDEDLLTN